MMFAVVKNKKVIFKRILILMLANKKIFEKIKNFLFYSKLEK